MRVAVIKNMMAPYTTPLFAALAARPEIDLCVFYEVPMESNRRWRPETDLPYRHLVLQSRSISLSRVQDEAFVHLPRHPLRQLRDFDPRVVIASGSGVWSSPADIAALVGRRRGGWAFVPWWESFRRPDPALPRYLLEPWVRYFMRAGDAWIASGTRSAADLVALGADAARVVVSPNVSRPPERRRRSAARPDGHPPSYLFVGTLSERKGIDVLLDAFRDVPAGTLTIAGDGPLRPLVEQAAAEDRRVQYVGHLDWNGLDELYARHDVLVVPSRYDVWGLVINEACEHGLLVVATDQVGAADDLVQVGVNGLIVAPESSPGLSESMRAVAAWPRERRVAGAAWGRARMESWGVEQGVEGVVQACLLAIEHRRR
jgi:glycosyltransferase involved in cell wall biosynthesis